jgi:hypothetical protein
VWDHVYGSPEVGSSSPLKKLVIVLGLAASLSACAGPYGNTGYGSNQPPYSGYGPNTPVYYGPGYYAPHTSEHGTVQY